jgi:hypothetical protein
MLKKEFKRKDVERARNLIQGKAHESSEIQVGYTKKQNDYKEGDVWEEDGKRWTIKNGIKQTATKLDNIKKEAVMPLFCPECGTLMKKRLDKKMYNIHHKCFDCVVEMEHKLKIEGKFDEYAKNIVANNAEDYTNHLESYLMEAINSSNSQYVSEKGEVERWKGGINKEELAKETKEALNNFRDEIKKYKEDDKT